jgi:hypothetical protein
MRELRFAPRDAAALMVTAVASVLFALPYGIWQQILP